MKKRIIFALLFALLNLQACLTASDNTVEGKRITLSELKALPITSEIQSVLEEEIGEAMLMDMNFDGNDELIIRTSIDLLICERIENEFEIVYSGTYSVILENGMIQYHRPGGAPLHDDYMFFVYEQNEYKEKVSLSRYDENEDGQYDEQDVYFLNDSKVTMGEWNASLQLYQKYDEIF
ncbi:MAG: hypothetical protein IKY23_11150 [Lachnospiraceae bacterium]|nr:hypothetical protein [Lachnospiraceae bacterium]